MESIKSRYDEIYAHCATTPMWFIHQADPRKTLQVPPDEREAFWEKLYAEPGFTLIDTLDDEPIERITPHGIRTTKQAYDFDVLIYATGFDGVTGAFDRIDIRGSNGLRLKDAWAESPRTYLGM